MHLLYRALDVKIEWFFFSSAYVGLGGVREHGTHTYTEFVHVHFSDGSKNKIYAYACGH